MISSSVTLLSFSLIPNILATPAVLFERIHMKGDAIFESTDIGPAIALATFSALLIPMRFGTSSPSTIEKYVTIMTIRVFASPLAVETGTPHFSNTPPRERAISLPEKIPVRIPIKVMPICMVDKNLSGSPASLSALFALLFPSSASL